MNHCVAWPARVVNSVSEAELLFFNSEFVLKSELNSSKTEHIILDFISPRIGDMKKETT